MTSSASFPSFSATNFLEFFVLFHGGDNLSDEEIRFMKASTQVASPFSQIQVLKELGNNLFRQNQFGQAGGCYDTACRLLCSSLKDNFEFDLNTIISLAVSLCLNLAACANKLQGFEEALIYCSLVLNFFPSNAKALFRKAVALKKLNRFPEAHTALEEARLAEPLNKEIIRELEVVRQSQVINKNGKRVIDASLDTNDVRAGKMLVSPLQN
ncbi:uncharacterized protein LOC141632829 [Silene latifolia]|uniref:uncharacterized protein LOC141632829 n=1 Tax=Silene latifolia TaxID=37657 RepID=UPI003D783C26